MQSIKESEYSTSQQVNQDNKYISTEHPLNVTPVKSSLI